MSAYARTWSTLSPAGALGLKLYAFAAMVLDHFDGLLFDGDLGFHMTWGRTVLPIFAALLAFNLAHYVDRERALFDLAPRMALCGLLATLPHAYLLGAWIPANVMFTLAGGCALVALVQLRQYALAVVLGLVVGYFVDYGWFGLAGIVGAWAVYRHQLGGPLLAAAVVAFSVMPINGNAWGFASLPLIAAALLVDGNAPRLKWLFYVGYPLHLVGLAAIAVHQ